MDSARPEKSRTGVVMALGTTQTLSWASSYYLPAILAAPMVADLGISTPTVFAVFSMALMVAAIVGLATGTIIDHHGGRPVLLATNLLFAAGLLLLATAQGLAGFIGAWVLLGVAMGAGLYETAFATLVRLYGTGSRSVITGITLLAGFASTVGWPLSAFMEVMIGWRGACVVWAALQLVIGLPLNAWLPRAAATAPADITAGPPLPPAPRQSGKTTAALLSLVFTMIWFVSTAMAAHLPTLMMAAGGTLALAVTVGALVGPAQVAGRVLEFSFLRRLSPLAVARAATLAHPIGAIALWGLGAPLAATAFALLHGMGNGILTIAKGTLPLALFGPGGYGLRQGVIALPGRMLQGLAPWLFGIAIARWGDGVLLLSAALGLTAFGGLLLLRLPKNPNAWP